MFCSNCGQQLSDEIKFCSNCGKKNEIKKTVSSVAVKSVAVSEPKSVAPKRNKLFDNPPVFEENIQTESILNPSKPLSKFCSNCGNELASNNKFCTVCGQPTSFNKSIVNNDINQNSTNHFENTSGLGKLSIVPEEIKGWNWGAFGLNWIWGLGNSTYIALLCFVPLVNIVMIFVLGALGNEWAWRNQKWDSIQDFKTTQRKWRNAWFILLLVLAALIVLGILIATVSSTNNNSSTVYQ